MTLEWRERGNEDEDEGRDSSKTQGRCFSVDEHIAHAGGLDGKKGGERRALHAPIVLTIVHAEAEAPQKTEVL
eukprot:scaffold205029_cov33-Tisochrysis_lutea.AAC.2